MNKTPGKTNKAIISCNENGKLVSDIFEDIYFSVEEGPEETNHVFIEGNNLPERFKEKGDFTIIETGFGTGLNFLSALLLWKKTAPKESKLNFISVEKYPLKIDDLKKILSNWTEFNHISPVFLEKYQTFKEGFHTVTFESGRVSLTVFTGDIMDFLDNLNIKANAWFLDGFSPEKNPEMWPEKLFKTMEKFTEKDGTFTSFTASGIVKKGLRNNGFFVKRRPGFGKKRHMIIGHLNEPTEKKI